MVKTAYAVCLFCKKICSEQERPWNVRGHKYFNKVLTKFIFTNLWAFSNVFHYVHDHLWLWVVEINVFPCREHFIFLVEHYNCHCDSCRYFIVASIPTNTSLWKFGLLNWVCNNGWMLHQCDFDEALSSKYIRIFTYKIISNKKSSISGQLTQ